MITSLRRIANTTGIGQPALWSVTTRGVQAGFGLFSVVLVSRRLSATEQGIFYTYASLLALLVVAEFGLSYAVMQTASHAGATLRWVMGRAEGDADVLRRLGTLAHRARGWLAREMVPVAGALALLGTLLLWRTAGQDSDAQASVALWLLTLVAGVSWQLTNPTASLLEGAGQVTAVWKLRCVQEVAAGVVLCCGLAAGVGLASLALSYGARALYGVVMVRRLFRESGLAADVLDPTFRWRADVWPFQWRVGLSIASGYLLFQSFAPILLALAGPVAAGQFGMTLAITNGLLAATTAWPTSQTPAYGALIARGAFTELDRSFTRTLLLSSALSAAGIAFVVGGSVLLRMLGSPIADRLLPAGPLAWLVGTALLNHVAFSLAMYLRAFRREPLLLPSVVGGIVTVAVFVACVRWSTLERTVIAYFLLTLLGLALTVTVFVICRKRWREDVLQSGAGAEDAAGLLANAVIAAPGAAT